MVYHTEDSWYTGEKVRQINGVSTITYSKIRQDDKEKRKRKKVPNNGAVRVKNKENQGTAVDKNITIGIEGVAVRINES